MFKHIASLYCLLTFVFVFHGCGPMKTPPKVYFSALGYSAAQYDCTSPQEYISHIPDNLAQLTAIIQMVPISNASTAPGPVTTASSSSSVAPVHAAGLNLSPQNYINALAHFACLQIISNPPSH